MSIFGDWNKGRRRSCRLGDWRGGARAEYDRPPGGRVSKPLNLEPFLATRTVAGSVRTARGHNTASVSSPGSGPQQAAANDNRNPRFRGGLPPIVKKLAKVDPEAAWSVLAYGRNPGPVAVFGDEAAGFENEAEIADGYQPIGLHAERRHQVRPSINVMLADVLRVRVTRHPDGSMTRHAGPDDVQRVDGSDTYRLAGMLFNFASDAERPAAGGLMVRYMDASGKTRMPRYDTSKPAGPDEDDDDTMAWTLRVGSRPGAHRPVDIWAPQEPEAEISETCREVVEMVLARFSYKGIGLHYKAGPDYADRKGKRLVAGAVEELKKAFPPPARKAA